MNLYWFPMKTLISLVIASAAMCATALSTPATAFAPDLLIVNASIHTMDAAQLTAEAVAVLGHRILALGTTSEQRGMAGPKTRVVDAHHHTVFPGFNDAHTHFLETRMVMCMDIVRFLWLRASSCNSAFVWICPGKIPIQISDFILVVD
jgi:hypothetical protein